jgi:hypothetical protein
MTTPLPDTPVLTSQDVDTSPISSTPARGDDLDPIWASVVVETRTRGNDIHLPISLAYAERLCDAYPAANRLLVRVAILLHDVGWARVDETRIISEGFSGDWRRAAIRYEHESRAASSPARCCHPWATTRSSSTRSAASSTSRHPRRGKVSRGCAGP